MVDPSRLHHRSPGPTVGPPCKRFATPRSACTRWAKAQTQRRIQTIDESDGALWKRIAGSIIAPSSPCPNWEGAFNPDPVVSATDAGDHSCAQRR